MAYEVKPFNFKLTSADYGAVDYADALQKGLKTTRDFEETRNTPSKLAADLLATQLANKYNSVKADYANKSIPADIAFTQSSTNKNNIETTAQNIRNGFLSESERARIGSENATANLQNTNAYEQQIKNGFLKQREPAEIAEIKARENYYNQGGGRGGVDNKNLSSFKQQISMDHPDWDVNKVNDAANNYLVGSDTFSNGEKLIPMSGLAQQNLLNAQSHNAPNVVKTRAASLNSLVQDLQGFDIEAMKSFAGPKGKARLLAAKAQMVTNPDDPNIDPVARRFLSAANQSIKNMDAMRLAYGTSVVPDYVYKTIGRLTNPNDSIWNDATQIGINFNDTIKSVQKDRDLANEQVKHGVTSQLKNEEKSSSNDNIKRTKYINDENGNPVPA